MDVNLIAHEKGDLHRDDDSELLSRDPAETRTRHDAELDEDWWHEAMTSHELVTADAVLAELDLTPEPKRTDCLNLLADIPVLDDTVEIDELVDFYIAHKLMPASQTGDARHLALAALHGCDVLATWNCRHIANPDKLEHIYHIHELLGLRTPVLATPHQLLEAEK